MVGDGDRACAVRCELDGRKKGGDNVSVKATRDVYEEYRRLLYTEPQKAAKLRRDIEDNCFGYLMDLLDEIDRLTAALAAEKAKREAAEKRTEAAIADLKVMALAMRESEEMPEGCCFACLYESENLPDNVLLAYGECPGFDSDECFEWRGLDDALNGRR